MAKTIWAISLRSFFFFQAEDGIRDLIVTGVQTCALPISGHGRVIADRRPRHAARNPLAVAELPRRVAPVVVFDAPLALLLLGESDVEVEVEIGRASCRERV